MISQVVYSAYKLKRRWQSQSNERLSQRRPRPSCSLNDLLEWLNGSDASRLEAIRDSSETPQRSFRIFGGCQKIPGHSEHGNLTILGGSFSTATVWDRHARTPFQWPKKKNPKQLEEKPEMEAPEIDLVRKLVFSWTGEKLWVGNIITKHEN